MAEPLITVPELERRLGHSLPGALAVQAGAILEDVSAEVRDIAKPELDTVEWPDTPALVIAVMVSIMRRALRNPLGLSGEAIDGHQWQGSNQTGQWANDAEKSRIRRAVGKTGVTSVILEGDLPIQPRQGVSLDDELSDSFPTT